MAIVSLAGVDGECFQQSNVPGVRTVLAVLKRDIVGNYPIAADIDATKQELSALPTLVATKKWSKFMFPVGTADHKSDSAGDLGYQNYKHSVEFALAGKSGAVRVEMSKFVNAGALFLIEEKDGSYTLRGSTDDPISVQRSYASGKGGNDKKGYTAKGEADGIPFADLQVAATLLEDLEVNTIV